MAASDYFRTMFKSCYEESQCCEVVLPGVEEDDLEPIVNYFYTGSIIINGDNVGSLLSAASLLLLPRLSQGDLTIKTFQIKFTSLTNRHISLKLFQYQ